MIKGRLVAKYGTSSNVDEFGMSQSRVDGHAANLMSVKDRYPQLSVVGSGSVAEGRRLWRAEHAGEVEPSKQTLAARGAAYEYLVWDRAFAKLGKTATMLQVTHRQIDDPVEQSVMLVGIEDMFKWGLVPKINENDVLSTFELDELGKGYENDRLASHYAQVIGAEVLLLLTSKGGLIDDSGKEVRHIILGDEGRYLDMAEARTSKSKEGSGGFYPKLVAACEAAEADILTFIASSDAPIEAILTGDTGTCIAKAA